MPMGGVCFTVWSCVWQGLGTSKVDILANAKVQRWQLDPVSFLPYGCGCIFNPQLTPVPV